MRHRISGVVSIGHFDNFCCWQFGENSSAHRDGLDIMVKEISALSCDNSDNIGGFHSASFLNSKWVVISSLKSEKNNVQFRELSSTV